MDRNGKEGKKEEIKTDGMWMYHYLEDQYGFFISMAALLPPLLGKKTFGPFTLKIAKEFDIFSLGAHSCTAILTVRKGKDERVLRAYGQRLRPVVGVYRAVAKAWKKLEPEISVEIKLVNKSPIPVDAGASLSIFNKTMERKS